MVAALGGDVRPHWRQFLVARGGFEMVDSDFRVFKNIIEEIRSFLLPPSKLQNFSESSGPLSCPNLKLSFVLVISIRIRFWVSGMRRIKFSSDGFKNSRWIKRVIGVAQRKQGGRTCRWIRCGAGIGRLVDEDEESMCSLLYRYFRFGDLMERS
ncbi:hypothetical protein OROMI_019701 [Orobanche minor]